MCTPPPLFSYYILPLFSYYILPFFCFFPGFLSLPCPTDFPGKSSQTEKETRLHQRDIATSPPVIFVHTSSFLYPII